MKIIFNLFLYFSVFLVCFCSDKIKLSEVQTLTLYSNRKTNGRRSAGVPQLECTGGSLNCGSRYIPNVVQCTNVGNDDYDVQWTCKAELATSVKFGHIDISCEGYDFPNDKYVLKGSCGLRYTLEGSRSHKESNTGHIKDNTKISDNGFNNVMMLILVVVVIVIIVCWYNSNSRPDTPQTYASCPPPPGFRPEFTMDPNAPNFCEPPSYTSVFNEPKTRQYNNESSGPGFWTGLGTGGLMGYMFGSHNRRRSYESMPSYTEKESRHVNDNHYSEPRNRSPEFRTASGFGGTSRR